MRYQFLKMRLIRIWSVGVFLLTVWSGCSKHRLSRLAPPISEMDIPFQTHRFEADSGISIRLATGTEIRIDPGSWMDADRKIVHGEIEFRVREFHSADDIFRSGIPLTTRRSGSDRLQSAGMIEMRAFLNKAALEVATGKSIDVRLAGYRNSSGYDLWYMDDNETWTMRGKYRMDSNRTKIQAIRSLGDSLKKPRSPQEEENRSFELVGNITEIPYLKPYVGMKWKLDDSEPIEVLGVPGRVHWENVRIHQVKNRHQVYALTFTQFERGEGASGSGIQKTILASPMTSRSDMKKRMAIYEKEVAEAERRERERQAELARLKREADLVQSFKADRVGIWNVDRFQKMEDCIPVYVRFDFENSFKDNEKKIRLFALYDGDNSVMEYDPSEWKAVYLQKGKPMRLIAVLPNDQLALVGNETIQPVLQQDQKEVTFQTKRISAREFMRASAP